MPPKAPTGRGRGRGRGRGGSAGTTRSTATTADTAEQPAADASSSSTPAPVAQMTPAPSTEPTAPAANTAAPSVTPAAGPSIARVASVRRGGASASPAPSTRGKRPVVPAPKAVRRSKEDRAAIQAELDKKKAQEARAALRDAKKAGRGRGNRERGRGGKARGGFMGDSDRRTKELIASGPLSAGQVSAEGSYRSKRPTGGFGGGGGGGFSGGGGGGARIKTEGGGSSGIKVEDGGYISSDLDEADEGPRKDIDKINLVSDEEDVEIASMAPIRVKRQDHKERDKPVAVDTRNKDGKSARPGTVDLEADGDTAMTDDMGSPVRTKGKRRAKDVQVIKTERRWKGAWEDSEDEMEVKPEPIDDDDVAITAQPVQAEDGTQIKESASPETRRKTKGKAVARRPQPEQPTEGLTKEELAEIERHEDDLRTIRTELGELVLPSKKPDAPPPSTEAQQEGPVDEQGDIKMVENPNAPEPAQEEAQAEPTTIDKRADRVYLFQFPPILPSLLASAPVKPEPNSPTLSRKIPAATEEPITIDADAATAPAKDKGKGKQVKPDPDTAPSSATQAIGASPSGLVGKLRVHASGRTTLDWGGTALQIGMGTDVQFLQDVVVAKFDEEQAKEGGDESNGKSKEEEEPEKEFGGQVMGLGQVRGKFVVTPDWEEIVGVRI